MKRLKLQKPMGGQMAINILMEYLIKAAKVNRVNEIKRA